MSLFRDPEGKYVLTGTSSRNDGGAAQACSAIQRKNSNLEHGISLMKGNEPEPSSTLEQKSLSQIDSPVPISLGIVNGNLDTQQVDSKGKHKDLVRSYA